MTVLKDMQDVYLIAKQLETALLTLIKHPPDDAAEMFKKLPLDQMGDMTNQMLRLSECVPFLAKVMKTMLKAKQERAGQCE